MTPPPPSDETIGTVAIGRNEGERLKRCLRSIVGGVPVVYVDSGSTDGSQTFAESLGVAVVALAVPPHFTAARARNAGIARLRALAPQARYVQTIDGDCEIAPGWMARATAALDADPTLGAVTGRLHERHPERSIYNALCDHEWDAPVGEVPGFGGIAMLRLEALAAAGFYRDDMIAGEDTELAMRMRKAGWHIARLPGDMAWHDADITRFGQWWRRAKRGGHGFAEMAFLHPDARWPNWPGTCRSIVVWGGLFPLALLIALAIAVARGWWAVPAVLVIGWAVQAGRIAWRGRRAALSPKVALAKGVLLMLGKLPELTGLIQFHRNHQRGTASTLIEYKGPEPA